MGSPTPGAVQSVPCPPAGRYSRLPRKLPALPPLAGQGGHTGIHWQQTTKLRSDKTILSEDASSFPLRKLSCSFAPPDEGSSGTLGRWRAEAPVAAAAVQLAQSLQAAGPWSCSCPPARGSTGGSTSTTTPSSSPAVSTSTSGWSPGGPLAEGWVEALGREVQVHRGAGERCSECAPPTCVRCAPFSWCKPLGAAGYLGNVQGGGDSIVRFGPKPRTLVKWL